MNSLKKYLEKLDKKRERKKLSVAEVAHKVGITRQAYYKIIKGESGSLYNLNKIVEILDKK